MSTPLTTGALLAHDRGANKPGPALRYAYERQFRRALVIQRRAGEISRSDYRRLMVASSNDRFIGKFIIEIEGYAKKAGSFIDDIRAWITQLVKWMIDNWDTVLRIAFSLLLILI